MDDEKVEILSSVKLRESGPYESRVVLRNGKTVRVRPIAPTDEPLMVELLGKLSPDSIYMRFLRPVETLPKELLFHLTHLDDQKSYALAAVINDKEKESLIAVARLSHDPREKTTDFAIVVQDDWQRCGLGGFMLSELFEAGRRRGLSILSSVIDSTNRGVKQLLRKTGCTVHYSHDKGTTKVEVWL